jgi:hypothetical protein
VWIGLIQTDLNRTFSHWVTGLHHRARSGVYDIARERTKDGDACLRRVLGCYALHNPDLGYTQGMSYIVAMLLLYTDPTESFILLANLLKKSLLMSMFKMDYTKVHADTHPE